MQTHIHKWGNSLGLRIPSQVAKQLGLHLGSLVNIEIKDSKLIIQAPKYTLDNLLKDITKKNQHHQALDDKPRGNEEW